MPLTPTEVQAVGTAEAAKMLYVSVHTADPSTTGANEATGGSPAYARKSTTLTSTSGVATGTQVTVDLAAGTYPYGGLWSAVTGGTFYGGFLFSASQTSASQFQVKITPTITVSST